MPRAEEDSGMRYWFVDREDMEYSIRNHEFLEYGEHDGHIYGTRLSTIKEINREGVVSILDVEPNSLKILRNKTYSPLVVYIAPGTGSNQNPHDVSIIYTRYTFLMKLLQIFIQKGNCEKFVRH